MADLKTLSRRLNKRADELPEAANRLAIKTAIEIVEDLAYVTPVDESTALSNWQVTIGRRAMASIRAFKPGKKGSTQAASARATINAAIDALKAKKPGQTIYLGNVLPYIRKLNDGSSTQTPAGFVARAVLIGRLFVQRSRLFKR